MTGRLRFQNLGGARAIILHRPHATVQALSRQLAAIGLDVRQAWPELSADALSADFVFFDADMGYDAQFPWAPGASPMPLIALIGSEAPGRIEWSLDAGADAQILKPVGDSGAYSALLIARAAFEQRRRLGVEAADLRRRLEMRQTIVQAVMRLVARGMTEAAAYDRLRQMAMAWRISFEDAAFRVASLDEREGIVDDRRELG